MDLIAIQETLGHAWIATTMNYVHVHRSHIEDAWVAGQQTGSSTTEGTPGMRWNLRLTAANRGIWKASDLQRLLAERGLVISAGKMSGLWSGKPASIKLADLDVICAVLDCGVDELLVPEPDEVANPADDADAQLHAVNANGTPPVVPRRRDGRSLPPE